MKKTIIEIVKIVSFFVIFLFLFQRVSWCVSVYGTDVYNADRRSCLFFALPRNTVDVMFVGTSHVYCSYIPQQIYNDTGITSACLATSSQSYANSYWLL